ncbi:hypothetical protein V1460_26165 [Streptomyces sp. SCSIO 30461]|uniref:hypothetical protein n=1 Tax=Streptomyces sp. SCSIO 30461 TaxID=3118085 RepID=UPI0030CADB36
MSTGTVVAIVIALAVLLALVVMVSRLTMRRRRLRQRFGPEYDRAVETDGAGRRSAERELHAREQRHRALDIRELPPEARERYTMEWKSAEERFVDQPRQSVDDADHLVTRLMGDRGYPTDGYEQQVRDLSVEHANTLEHYRAAHEVNVRNQDGSATTEELRGAMVHYRTLFRELLGNQQRDTRYGAA